MFLFADSFDVYTNDMGTAALGYWDANSVSPSNTGFTAPGRFGGQALWHGSGTTLLKTSGQNDAVHHIVVACQQAAPALLTGTTLGRFFRFDDGTTAQCSVVFRSDGAILLTSGGPAGTVLATYPAAVTLVNQWFAFEIEVVINNTTGSFKVRSNNASSDSFSATGLNTRGGTANNYANRLGFGIQTSINYHYTDDLLWRSDPTSLPWVGDVRCYTRMPVSDASVQFATAGLRITSIPGGGGNSATAGTGRYTSATVPGSGQLTAVNIFFNGSPSYTGNIKCALFNDNAGAPGTLLATANNIISNPPNGNTTPFTFSGLTVTAGQKIWIGICPDTGATFFVVSNGSANYSSTTPAYASWPPATVTPISGAGTINCTFTVVPINSSCVNEANYDGSTTYVYDSVVGHADFYGIAGIGVTPPSTIAVTTRMYAQKSDAGSRNGAVQLRSNGSGATFEPATVSAVTLSGGNLVATNTGTTSTLQGAHAPATAGQTTGKFYIEYTVTNYAGGAGVAFGVGTTVSTFDNMSTFCTHGNMIFVVGHSGTGPIWSDTSNSGFTLGRALTTGDVVAFAIDVNNRKCWIRLGATGPWNGPGSNGDPVAGTSYLGLATGTIVPFVTFGSGISGAAGVAGNVITANFGGSAFVGAVPSGYTSGWPSPVTVNSGSGTLSTTWANMYRTDLTDPATGAAWTAASVNALQVGPLVVS